MTTQPNPEDNASIYGCSGCDTTAGRSGCPIHGTPVMTVVGYPDVAAVQSEIAKLREELERAKQPPDVETWKELVSEIYLKYGNSTSIAIQEITTHYNAMKAERDQQAARIERLEQDCKEWAEVNQEQAHVLVIRTAEMNQQAARLREIRERLTDLNTMLTVPAAEYVPVIPEAWLAIEKIVAIIDRERSIAGKEEKK